MLIIFNKTQSRDVEVTPEEWQEALDSGDPWGWFDAWVSDMYTDEMYVTAENGDLMWERDS